MMPALDPGQVPFNLQPIASEALCALMATAYNKLRIHQDETISGSGRRDAFDRLTQEYEAASEPGWDGQEAPPVRCEAYVEAARFLEKLPAGFPIPEIDVVSDGSIAFEWHVRRYKGLLVSFYGTQVATYSGFFGNRFSAAYGTFLFVDAIPEAVIQGLRALYASE